MRDLLAILFFFLIASTPLLAYDAEIDGIYYNFSGDEAEVTYKKTNGDYNIPSSDYSGIVEIPVSVFYEGKNFNVTSIGAYAFYGCDALTSIVIPESVTFIGAQSFAGCRGLTHIAIPLGVKSIEDKSFYECTNLETVIIPEGVKIIGGQCFYNCSSMSAVNLPSTVADIKEWAFEGCGSLASFTIPEGVSVICDGIFYRCSSLKSVTIPQSVTYIGIGAFADCSSLSAIELPNGVTAISEDAFQNCSNLTNVIFPESLNYIDSNAFRNCIALNSMICKSQNPSRCGVGAFNGVDKEKCLVKVPQGSKEAYSNADEWKDFNIIEMETSIFSPLGKTEEATTIYDLGGRKMVNGKLPKGLYIVNGKVMVGK